MKYPRKIHLSLVVIVIVLLSLSAHAMEESSKHITVDDFSFVLNPLLATNVNVVAFSGDPVDEIYPGGPQPPYMEFFLYKDLPVPEVMLQSSATIRVYPLAHMDGYDAHQANVKALQKLLSERPNLAKFEEARDSLSEITLPFLPIMPGAQVIRARSEYVHTETVDGITYLTVYRQDVAPFFAHEFIYTFQGLSTDGKFYISVVMPIKATMFDEVLPTDFDFEAFIPTMTTYFNESIITLNDASVNEFEPELTVGRTLIESIVTH